MDQLAVLTLAITKLLISSVEGDFQTTNLKFKCQTKNVKIKLAGTEVAHLYRPGLDGRPTYAHGEENPLQRAESVGRGVYIQTGGEVVDHKFYKNEARLYDQVEDDLQLVRRHFLDQPLEFPFGQPDQLFDQPDGEGAGKPVVRGGLDYLDGDYHLFAPSSLEAPLAEPEYFDPLNYYDEGLGMDYDFGNLQEEIEYQNLQNKEQAQDQGQMLVDFLEMLNETTVKEESKMDGRGELYESKTEGREELYKKEMEGRGELYELAQLRQAGFLPLESKAKEPEEEVKCLHMVRR